MRRLITNDLIEFSTSIVTCLGFKRVANYWKPYLDEMLSTIGFGKWSRTRCWQKSKVVFVTSWVTFGTL